MTEEHQPVRRTTRLILTCGVLVGLWNIAFAPVVAPEQFMLASDVYRHAADAMLAGEPFYSVSPPRLPGYTFIYPPIVIVVFVPHAVLGTAVGAFTIQTVLNVIFALGTTALISRALARRGVALSRVDVVVIASFTLISAHSAITFINGQVTIWLGFAFAAGIHLLDTDRELSAGVAVALAALVKVFPAAFGLWFLRTRAWKAVGAALATGVGGLVLGAIVLGPDVTVTFFEEVLLGRYEGETFEGRPEPARTVGGAQRQIAALTGLGSPLLSVLAVLAVAPVVVKLYQRVETDRQRLAAVLGTIIGFLLVFPLQRLYMPLFAFPLVVLLYTLPSGRARSVFLLGLLFSYARVSYEVVMATLPSLPVPAVIESGLRWAATLFYTVLLPSTLGLWLLLGACVLVSMSERSRTDCTPTD